MNAKRPYIVATHHGEGETIYYIIDSGTQDIIISLSAKSGYDLKRVKDICENTNDAFEAPVPCPTCRDTRVMMSATDGPINCIDC